MSESKRVIFAIFSVSLSLAGQEQIMPLIERAQTPNRCGRHRLTDALVVPY